MHRPDLKLSLSRLPRLPKTVRIPTRVRLPRLSRPRFAPLTMERLQAMSSPLGFFFYLVMFVAVVAIFNGATGTGLLLMLAGASLHVVRSSIEELAARRLAGGERKREVRLRSHRVARARQERPAPVAAAAAAAPEPIPRPVAPAPAPAAQIPSAPEFRVTASAPRPRRRRVTVR